MPPKPLEIARQFNKQYWGPLGMWGNAGYELPGSGQRWLLLSHFFKRLLPDPAAPEPYTLVQRLQDAQEFQKLPLDDVQAICTGLLAAPAFSPEKIGDPDYISTEAFNQIIANLLGTKPSIPALIGQSRRDGENQKAFEDRLTYDECKVLHDHRALYQKRREIVAAFMFHYIDALYSKLIAMRQEFFSLKKGYKQFVFLQQWPKTIKHIEEIFAHYGNDLLSHEQKQVLQKKYKKYKKIMEPDDNRMINFRMLSLDFVWHYGMSHECITSWCEEAKVKLLPSAFRDMAQEIVRRSAQASSAQVLEEIYQDWRVKQAELFEFLPEASLTPDKKTKKLAQMSAEVEWALLEKFNKLSALGQGEVLLLAHLDSVGKQDSQLKKQIAVCLLNRARSWRNWCADTFPTIAPKAWHGRAYALLSAATQTALTTIASQEVVIAQPPKKIAQLTRQKIREFPRLTALKGDLDQLDQAGIDDVSEFFIGHVFSLGKDIAAFDVSRIQEGRVEQRRLESIQEFLLKLELSPVERNKVQEILAAARHKPTEALTDAEREQVQKTLATAQRKLAEGTLTATERKLAKETLTAAWMRLINSVALRECFPHHFVSLSDAIVHGTIFDQDSVPAVTQFILTTIQLEQTWYEYLSNRSDENQKKLSEALQQLLFQPFMTVDKLQTVAVLVEAVLQTLSQTMLESLQEKFKPADDLMQNDANPRVWVTKKIVEGLELSSMSLSGAVCDDEFFAPKIADLQKQLQAVDTLNNLELFRFVGAWVSQKQKISALCARAANRNTAEFEKNIKAVNKLLENIRSAWRARYTQSFGQISEAKDWVLQAQQTLFKAVLVETPQAVIASANIANSSATDILQWWNQRQASILKYLPHLLLSLPRALDQVVAAELAFFAYIKEHHPTVVNEAQNLFVARLHKFSEENLALKEQVSQLILKQARSWRNWFADSFLGALLPSDWRVRQYDLLNAETVAALTKKPVDAAAAAVVVADSAAPPAPLHEVATFAAESPVVLPAPVDAQEVTVSALAPLVARRDQITASTVSSTTQHATVVPVTATTGNAAAIPVLSTVLLFAPVAEGRNDRSTMLTTAMLTALGQFILTLPPPLFVAPSSPAPLASCPWGVFRDYSLVLFLGGTWAA